MLLTIDPIHFHPTLCTLSRWVCTFVINFTHHFELITSSYCVSYAFVIIFIHPLKCVSFPLCCSFSKKLRVELGEAFPSLTADDLTVLVPNKEDVVLVRMYCYKGESVLVYQVCLSFFFFFHTVLSFSLFFQLTYPYIYCIFVIYLLYICCLSLSLKL